MNKDTRLCISLAGRPGNFGTRFHNFLYREMGLNFLYKAFRTEDIAGAISGIRALGIRGSAVSMPFKEKCIACLDGLDGSAEGIASVNTIVNHEGRLIGYNTDYSAVLRLLREREIPVRTEFAVFGSGGMAKAVVCALKDAGFRQGWVIARNEREGVALAERYGFTWLPELGSNRPGLLVNATPLGMAGEQSESMVCPRESVADAKYVFDVVAVPSETPFIRFARSLGKTVITGDEVLVLQSVEQFVLYTGVRPDPVRIERAAAFARS